MTLASVLCNSLNFNLEENREAVGLLDLQTKITLFCFFHSNQKFGFHFQNVASLLSLLSNLKMRPSDRKMSKDPSALKCPNLNVTLAT